MSSRAQEAALFLISSGWHVTAMLMSWVQQVYFLSVLLKWRELCVTGAEVMNWSVCALSG